jgi:eukaryotic-like serine/threonine-protein kinase
MSSASDDREPGIGGDVAVAMTGRLVGDRYRIMGVLGRGGMSTVYEGVEERSRLRVAIKLMHRARLNEQNWRRFQLEGDALATIDHPSVVRVLEHGLQDEVPFLVMEYIEGESLREHMAREPLELAEGIAMMLELLDALTAVHARGILHRDVKPTNILVTRATASPIVGAASSISRIKLVDFGVARRLRTEEEDEEDTNITETGLVPGTASYLSQEQLSGARDLDQRVDVWAAGLVLYEIVTGRRAYPMQSFRDVATWKSRRPPPAPGERPIPPELTAVVATAMALDRLERYATAGAFREALVAAWACHRAAMLGVRPKG